MNKKLLAGLLAAGVLVSVAACGDVTETTTGETPLGVTTTASGETTTAETTTEETTTGTKIEDPIIETDVPAIERVKVGQYITLQYNAASVDLTWEVQKGVGSRESVVFTVKPKGDYSFDGWSEKNAMVNGTAKVSDALTYTVNATENMTLFCNTSMKVRYHLNGGELKNGATDTDTFSTVFHQNPNTRPDTGDFTRAGYTLMGYNTKADGTGEEVSIGSKVTGGKGLVEVYCIWAKTAEASDFDYEEKAGGIVIRGYKGAETGVLAIPETIDGKSVITIAGGAFTESAMTKVLLPKTVKTVERGAFTDCKALETAVFYDSITSFSDGAFSKCDKFENVRIHTTTMLINDWFSSSAAKIDRLIWAEDKKKIIIIGGSGSLMGYDSSIIDEALGGEYEVINFAENANVTSMLYFDIVSHFVKEGDIILWCPEPGSYTLGSYACGSRFWVFRKSNYDFTKYIDLDHYTNFFSTFATYCKDLETRKFKGYDALSASMNPYGDDMSDRIWNGIPFEYSFRARSEAEYDMIAVFDEIKAKGADIYFSFAAMQESGIAKVSADSLKAYEDYLVSFGVTSISDYNDCIYPDDMFYDSPWHMTDDGARERAKQVAEDLKKALGLA